MKNLKQKGITLIALVVTIVVLLILAGVTISMLTGENGIINQAKNAKEESLKSELEELVDLTLTEYKTDKAVGKDTDLGDLLNEKVKDKTFDAVTEEGENYIVEKNGYEVKVSKDGERLTDAEKVGGVRPQLEISKSYDEIANKVTITVKITNKSELGKIDSFKLFDFGNQEVAEKTSGEDNKTFEVDKNGTYKVVVQATTNKVTKTSTNSIIVDEFEVFSDIYTETKKYTDSEGNTAWIPQGFAVGVSDSINKISTGLVITDKINEKHESTGNEFVWIPVGEYKVKEELKLNELSRIQWGTENDTIKEPISILGDDELLGYGGMYYGEGNTNSIAKDTIEKFKTSVKSKKGFYIGRFESGTEIERTSENDNQTIPLIQKEKYVYNYITRDQANNQAKLMYTQDSVVVSELISSYAWDTVINFLCQTNENGYLLATTTDSEYANINTNSIKRTGEYKLDKFCNIYDLLGNVVEWTTEYSGINNYPFVFRGGGYGYSNFFLAFRHYASSSYMNSAIDIGFRIQLYIL